MDGSLDLENAIKVSSDDFFYNLGALTNSPAPNGGPLQHWAHQYGIGRKTGIDLPGENSGNAARREVAGATATRSRPSATAPPARSATPTG